MSTFNLAIGTVLRREGGFVNNVNDAGGATNFGVSLRWLKTQGLIPEIELMENHPGTNTPLEDVKNMTAADASDFYQKYWWLPAYEEITAQALATKVFDTAVNMGAGRAARLLQQAAGVGVVDGVLGPKTLATVNGASALGVYTTFQTLQAQFYRNIVLAHPSEAGFLNGWLNRAYDRC
jgi:lysozyme family protein